MKYVNKTFKVLFLFILIISTAIILMFGHRDIPLHELKLKYANKASSFVVVNGMDVHFRDEGDQSDALPLVLIHGTGSSLHTFDVWTERLKKTNRVIRMDLPAYGLTGSFPDHNYSMENYTVFLKDFLTALGIKKCILVGNSLGGQIAWNFTLEQPNTVAKLILIDAAGYPKKSKSEPVAFKVAKTPVLNKLLTYVTPRFLIRASVENIYFNPLKVTDSLVDRYFELTLRAGNRQAFVDRFQMSVDVSSLTKIKDIQQPTLILWGANDLLIPVQHAYKFQQDLQNDTLVILENTGHTPMEESPFESLIPVINFINKLHVGNK